MLTSAAHSFQQAPPSCGQINARTHVTIVWTGLQPRADTLVFDPFFSEMPKFFNLTFKELLAAKHPTTWVEFECAEIEEDEAYRRFFADDARRCDGPALRKFMAEQYRYIDGVEPILTRLQVAGYEMHAMSNYPVWYKLIEDKLHLSRHLQWTFLSCEGVMKGIRKPAPEAYARAVQALQRPPAELIFVDDRQINVDAAKAAGLDGFRFEGAEHFEQQLLSRGLEF